MKEIRVVIPEEKYRIIEFKQDDSMGVAFVNSNLMNFESKEVFAWHCSIMIQLKEEENGLPLSNELKIVDDFKNSLSDEIKGKDRKKPNALFLAKIFWDNTCELIWRVYDPEIVNMFFVGIIDSKDYPRPFDYRIDPDVEWELTKWHLGNQSK